MVDALTFTPPFVRPASLDSGKLPGLGPRERVFLLFSIAAYLVSAVWHVLHGQMNVDEGFYAAASRAVIEGQMPYLDFGFTQPPLVAYVNGFVMQFIGFGLFEQRLVNGLWGALAMCLAVDFFLRCGCRRCAVLLPLVLGLCPQWMYSIHLGKTYGLACLLVTMAAWLLICTRPGCRKIALLAALGVLGMACRYPMGPYFAIVGVLSLLEERRSFALKVGVGAFSFLLVLVLVWYPFVHLAADNLQFWTLSFHGVSMEQRQWSLGWRAIFTEAPHIWVLGVSGIIVMTGSFARWGLALPGLALACGVAVVLNLFPKGAYDCYATPLLPALLMATLVPLAQALDTVAVGVRVSLISAVVLSQVLLVPVLNWWNMPVASRGTLSQWLPASVDGYKPSLASDLALGSGLVSALVPEQEPFIGPALILAIEAKRKIPSRLMMGPFSLTDEMTEAEAERRHLMTHRVLRTWCSDTRVKVLGMFTRGELNYLWTLPSFRNCDPADLAEWRRLIRKDFDAISTESGFWILLRRGALGEAGPVPQVPSR